MAKSEMPFLCRMLISTEIIRLGIVSKMKAEYHILYQEAHC